MQNPYETDKLVSEYLLFHYGKAEEILPYSFGPQEALGFAQRCVNQCLHNIKLPENARALDLGCAVGRSSFELTRYCSQVIGIDYSRRFIEAAEQLKKVGSISYQRIDEGRLLTPLVASVPENIDPNHVQFETGDAMNLREDLDDFDVVLMANLIDRLREPMRCLEQLPDLVKPGGTLIITSPYTWLEEFTPFSNWLGGYEENGVRISTLETLKETLHNSFQLDSTRDLPFLIREHARKFQWSIAQASIWQRLS